MSRDKELPILRDHYDFILWLQPKIGKFPRDLRFTLGERLERQLYCILDLLIRARYSRERNTILEQANVELEILRFHFRLAHDLHALPIKAYGLAAEKLTGIGRQLGGWQKQQSET